MSLPNSLEQLPKGTGIPKIIRAMKENGSPAPIFHVDEDHSFFATELPAHPATVGLDLAHGTDLQGNLRGDLRGNLRGTPQDPAPGTNSAILTLLQAFQGDMSRQALQSALGLSDRESFRKSHLQPALAAGLIEMTQPDKPNSRSQRYRLTEAGAALAEAGGGRT